MPGANGAVRRSDRTMRSRAQVPGGFSSSRWRSPSGPRARCRGVPVSAVLLTRYKIADLAAWTALETGRRLLPPGCTLHRLVREELYLLEPEAGKSPHAFEAPLNQAIESSGFFVNPNKERFRFLTSSGRGESLAAPEGAWGILARSRDETRDEVCAPGFRASDRRARRDPARCASGGSGPKRSAIKECYRADRPRDRRPARSRVNPHAERGSSDRRLDPLADDRGIPHDGRAVAPERPLDERGRREIIGRRPAPEECGVFGI